MTLLRRNFTFLIKGPDFPTGGIIYGEQGIRDALRQAGAG